MRTFRARILIAAVAVLLLPGYAPAKSRWRLVKMNLGSFPKASGLFFLDKDNGWAIAALDGLLKTEDAGKTWRKVSTSFLPPESALSRVRFLDRERGWLAGRAGSRPALWATTDGGDTWRLIHHGPEPPVGFSGGLVDVAFFDQQEGIAVGSDGFNAIIVVTTDGGVTWTIRYLGNEISSAAGQVEFADSETAWVLLRNALMRTQDGGHYWDLEYFESDGLGPFSMAVAGPSKLFVAGGWNRLIWTDDAVSWQRRKVPGRKGGTMYGWVCFPTDSLGWTADVNGEVLMTRNGGRTWTRDSIPREWVGPDDATGVVVAAGRYVAMLLSPGRLVMRLVDD